VLDVLLLLRREADLLELPGDLLRHLRAGEADRVVAGEVVVCAADHRRAAVQERLAVVLPVRLADELAVLGLDVLGPDLVRVVDVRVAVEDGELLRDACLTVRRAHEDWFRPAAAEGSSRLLRHARRA